MFLIDVITPWESHTLLPLPLKQIYCTKSFLPLLEHNCTQKKLSVLLFLTEFLSVPPLPSIHPSSTISQFRNLLQSNPCWRIFSVVEPTIWYLGDSPKYEWPIHEAQCRRLAVALLPPVLKTIFSAAVLALFPESNKRGTRNCPWNPQSIKPLWDASTWHKQSDLATMGKSYSALWDLGDTIALGFQSTH